MQIGSITYNIMNKDRPSKHVYTWWGLQCGELLWSFVFPYGLKKHARQKLSRSNTFTHCWELRVAGHRPAQGPSAPQIGSQRLCIS